MLSFKARLMEQLRIDLPMEQVQAARPFYTAARDISRKFEIGSP